MTFLVDADLPRSAADVVRRHGYHAVDVRDIGLRHADDRAIAGHAQREQQCVVTGDFDCADIRNYPPQHYAGLVVLVIPPTGTATYITQWLDSFLVQQPLIAQLPECTTLPPAAACAEPLSRYRLTLSVRTAADASRAVCCAVRGVLGAAARGLARSGP